MDASGFEVCFGVILILLEFWVILKVFIVWFILLVWL